MTIEYKGQVNVYPYKGDVVNIEIRRYGVDDYELVDIDNDTSQRGTLMDIFDYIQQY